MNLRLKIEKQNSIIVGYFLLFTSFLFLNQSSIHVLYEPGYLNYTALFYIGAFASIAIFKIKNIDTPTRFNLIDIAILLLILVLMIRWILTNNSFIYSKGAIALSILPIYFYVKQAKYIDLIHWAILVNGLVQFGIIILQKIGYVPNTDSLFELGGSFGNPNVLAMVLLMTIFSSVYLLKSTSSKLLKYFLLVYIFLVIITIVLTRCRSAMLALIIISILYLFTIEFKYSILKYRYLGLVSILTVFGVFINLLFTKSESLFGRILIWKSCLLKIYEEPVWGYGISTFHKIFPDAQKQFLENYQGSQLNSIAGNPKWAYNDFLELWLEGGIFIAIAFIFVLLSVLYYWRSHNRAKLVRNNPAILAVFSFFILGTVNFAFNAWSVLLLFVINLGLVSRSIDTSIALKLIPKYNLIPIIAILLFLGNVAFSLKNTSTLFFLSSLKTIDQKSLKEQEAFFMNNNQYEDYLPFAFKNASFSKRTGNFHSEIKILRRLRSEVNSYDTNRQLAEAYMDINELDSAKRYFINALSIIPNRLTPQLNLFMIEYELGNIELADSIRVNVFKQEFKGDPNYIKGIKNYMAKWN
ncbi:MAG: O-antigen ligase family protein [Candidatus Delongbacteria bacterium]|nr:O-antigen ligase family protein [Candidatus Delongbacteria bacterium]